MTRGGIASADTSAPTTSAYDCRPYLSGNAETCTIAATFSGVRHAAAASAAVTAAGVQPAIMELMDAASLAAVHALLALPIPHQGTAQLTIQTDGPAAAEPDEPQPHPRSRS